MNTKTKDIISYSLAILSIIALLIITNRFFFRIDLTADKRYTISDDTKEILKNLNDVVFIKVYLDGELDIPYARFRKKIKETLAEFKVSGKENIEYIFEDPLEGVTDETGRLKELRNQGFKIADIGKDKSGKNSNLIVPGALITYKAKSAVVNLLEESPPQSREELDKMEEISLNNSAKLLEYNLINAIKNISTTSKNKIGFLQGHGELDEMDVKDISTELEKSYVIEPVWINGKEDALQPYKLIIVAKPTGRFNEADKIAIDQYIMNGGKLLWAVDKMKVPYDSLASGVLLLPYDLNLDDMFFRYGVRIRDEIIEDYYSDELPLVPDNTFSRSRFRRWPFIPLLSTSTGNPVTDNLLVVRSEYISPIDTIEARKNIKKTVLLHTSDLTLTRPAASVISYSEVDHLPQVDQYDSTQYIAGVLLEGKFKSLYDSRNIQVYLNDDMFDIKKESPENKMIVLSDGDIIRNSFVPVSAYEFSIFPVGHNRYTGATFDNKKFLLNAINYLTDDIGLMKLRTRDFKVRPLNEVQIKDRRKWQIINLLIPSLLVGLFGMIFIHRQKVKYTA